ncbi:hypothetical protein M422DRAFT_176321 [Sphaerobolus stellatus SS14]|uniref:Inositol polyphosphate-related phosphatase domain-containing protein n=1 Tax=Sphaerobolus stellatus (strain SS14) TaxID=990650 RepID=A0A0C9UVA2_SPHS4|nr:hypothetical protein M422DRAFT_176321 [Sphaerobolus stellatus SS14]
MPTVPTATKPIRITSPPPLPSRNEPPTRILNSIESQVSKPKNNPALPPRTIEPPPLRTLNGLPPPPVRTVGLNDKLPAPRRRRASDDDSDASSDENDPSITLKTADASHAPIDELPDATHCSRRPPVSPSPFFRASVPIPSGSPAVVAGTCVIVAYHHYLRVYDLSKGVHSGLTTVDMKDIGLDFKKEARVTAMGFRAGGDAGDDSARFVWCGTKEGHLFELDTVRCAVVRLRPFAHLHTITKITRHERSMSTLDETGKVLVWRDYEDLSPGSPPPRVVRTMENQGFVRMFHGMLWMSNGSGSGSGMSSSNASSRGPTIRIYDVTSPNTTARLVIPSAPLGAVTSGAILPAHPGKVYLGHEGGYVSIWMEGPETFDSGRKVPVCVHTLKVASTDILALEGVMDRLWAGSRGGIIAAYDMVKRPWRLTNAWRGHGELPVSRIFVDPCSIGKAQTLNVVSVGRDEQMKFWDGLLGVDWIESELLKREQEFSSFRPLNVLICSWNIDAQKPDALNSGKAANVNFLKDVLASVERPDIIVFGFQELIDLENKSLTAKTVLLGGQKKNADGTLSDKVSRSYRMWYDALVHAVRLAMPVDDPYVVAHSDHLVGLFSCIFVRHRQKALLRDSAMKIVKRGLGGRYGNKGAIVARFVFDDTSLCFINCHLAAGQSHTRQRNQDIAAILEDGSAFPRSEVPDALPYAGGGDGSMIMDHEICFLNGDLNYRIDLRRDAVVKAIQEGDYTYLLNHDQLRKQLKNHPRFRLRAWTDTPIDFAPTYKYDRRSDEYDTSEKRRAPAWCDRILWHCRQPERVKTLHYTRYEVDVSDHRPISGAFAVTVKKIDQEARGVVKTKVQRSWKEREAGLLFELRAFYESQCIL